MRRAMVALIWMVLAAPAFSQSSESAKGGDSKLGVGDTVHITVFQQADLSSDARISERGTVAMALLGDTVYVDRGPVFYVYGEVPRGGAYRLEPNMTVMQAIVAGGGITPRGSERRLKLRRAGPDGKVVENDARPQDVVQPDDVIFV